MQYLTTEDTEEHRDYNSRMDGALIIDKPAGMTSHDVVARVRKIIGERRVGHTGTLDPFATGVLVVVVGRATRLAQFLSGAEKEYEAVIRLGYATDTGDVTGARVLSEPPAVAGGPHAKAQSTQSLSREEIESALASLRGEIEQTPPMYSARKIAGQKLYELARRGEEVERKAVRVNIAAFETTPSKSELLKQNNDGTRDLAVRVVCSAGTYVRSLAESVGERLGVGAHLTQLRRTRAGQFEIGDAITLDRLDEIAKSGSIAQALISPDAALAHLPFLNLDAADARRVRHGIDVAIEDAERSQWPVEQPVRLRDLNEELIAVGIYQQRARTVHPSVVIAE